MPKRTIAVANPKQEFPYLCGSDPVMESSFYRSFAYHATLFWCRQHRWPLQVYLFRQHDVTACDWNLLSGRARLERNLNVFCHPPRPDGKSPANQTTTDTPHQLWLAPRCSHAMAMVERFTADENRRQTEVCVVASALGFNSDPGTAATAK
jgi:hypothetical protein